jgi:hypothetical protein
MADVSKNARAGSGAQQFHCPCGGEVKMKSLFTNGKLRNVAECSACKRRERKPTDFRY